MTAQPLPSPAADLIALAHSAETADRERLLMTVAKLGQAMPGSEALRDILMILARRAERDIRRALSEQLADAGWAPPALIAMLALDEIEIARPVIARSALLADTELVRILVEATLEHGLEVARRPNLSAVVCDAVIAREEPALLTALAGNRSARIGEDGLRRLVAHAGQIAALRAPLARHPRLTETLAVGLYSWVGEALREVLTERFRLDEAMVGAAVHRAVDAALPRPPSTEPEDEADRRLVAKLKAAGQLRSGLLVRALREKRLGLFEQTLAALAQVPINGVRAAVRRPDPGALGLACTAVGVDRAVFPTLLSDVRALSGGWPGDNPHDPSALSLSPSDALIEFRAEMGL